ncbi:sperm-associated antigen 5 [Ctenodactylus gundi]
MWRVKKMNLGLSPSPQPGKQVMRTPLRELTLQPDALTNSGQSPPLCSTLTPSICKLGLQEESNNSSPLDFISVKKTDPPSELFSHPSKWLEVCQYESHEQPLGLGPQNNYPARTSGKAADPVDNYLVKTVVFESSSTGQQQDMTLKACLDTKAETTGSFLSEPLEPGDLVRKEVAPCTEDNFLEVVAAVPEEPTFQGSPSHLLDCPREFSCEQQLQCCKESMSDSRTEALPEDLVPSESKEFMLPSMFWLSPSTALADFSIDHVDQEEEIVEHIAMEKGEMSFPTIPEEDECRDHALVSDVKDVLSTHQTPKSVEAESQAVPGPGVEDTGGVLGSDSDTSATWMSPLTWLEKGVNTSIMLENLRQSLCLPSVLQDAATGTTPSSTCSVGTWFTPPAAQEKNTDKSQIGLQGTKESTSKTGHLLWGPPDLTALSRHDLEDNLLSSLVILEVLTHQLQDWKSKLAVPHPEAQDCSTQTYTSLSGESKKPQHLQESQEIRQALQQARNVMQSWVLVSKELMSLLHLSLLHIEEDKTIVNQEYRHAETLVSCCFDVLKKLKAKLQKLEMEREEAKHREEVALREKDAAVTVLEAFCAHASQRISQLQKDLKSTGEFRGLLQEAQTQLVGLKTEQEELAQQTVSLTSALQQDWTSMQLDYVTGTALLSRLRQLTEKLTTKSRQALQERDAAVEEKQQVSSELEKVSAHLEVCKGQMEQMKLENGRLAADLQAQLQILADMDSQLKELQHQHAHCAQDLATKDELLRQLTHSSEDQAARWEKEKMALKHTQVELQQQQAVLAKEVQDLKETLEFADQENQVAHLELGQVEYQLKTTLEVLRERSLQCENLTDTVENLKARLASIVAENEEQDLEKIRRYSQELGVLTKQLQNLALFLQTTLEEKAEPEVLLSTSCDPAEEHPQTNDSTFLGSILTAVTNQEAESAPVPLLGSEKSAFTRVASMVCLQPTETPDMEKSLAEMSTKLCELQSLCTLLQESKEEAIGNLQQKVCTLQTRLQIQEEQHQEAQKAKEADIEKLNQALCLRYKNEKELQEVIQKQNEKILEQIDKSGELISLREEVTQLTRSLRRAETESKVLQETLASQLDSNCQPMATNWIQEKVWLYQEVDKLRVMFLEMKDEKAKLMVKFQSQRNILEENLRRSDAELKKLDDTVQHIYETLLSIPEAVKSCKELQGLLEFLS